MEGLEDKYSMELDKNGKSRKYYVQITLWFILIFEIRLECAEKPKMLW